jgi:hypothetical protein
MSKRFLLVESSTQAARLGDVVEQETLLHSVFCRLQYLGWGPNEAWAPACQVGQANVQQFSTTPAQWTNLGQHRGTAW